MKNSATLITSFLFIILTSGCISPTINKQSHEQAPLFTPREFKAADFGEETKKLLNIIKSSDTGLEEKAEAHRRLAILYLIPVNPDHNEDKALDQLGLFLELTPQRLDKKEAADWVQALGTGTEDECRKIKEEHRSLSTQFTRITTENKELASANLKLAKDKEKLAADNTELKKLIDKIKKLDLSMEQKRKDYLR